MTNPTKGASVREAVAAYLHDRYASYSGLDRYDDLPDAHKEHWRLEADAILTLTESMAEALKATGEAGT